MSLREKVAIVTGGGQGIGKALTKRFLSEGIKVVIAEIDESAGSATEAEYQHLGSICFIKTDVSSESSVINLIKETEKRFAKIDVLVNNAAITHPENAPLTELSLEEWNRTISTNLTSVFLCSKYSAIHLQKSQGTIINIASTRALMSEPNTEAYSAAKGGVVALTHALAISLAPIRVNCISPGWIDVSEWQQAKTNQTELTPEDHQQHPVGRVGKPEDIASLAVYFASSDAAFITGTNFVVDGGMTKKMIYL